VHDWPKVFAPLQPAEFGGLGALPQLTAVHVSEPLYEPSALHLNVACDLPPV